MEIKNITYSKDARNKIKTGINKLAAAVGVTLGPAGRNVVIDKDYSNPVITKDGVSVAREIFLEDAVENAAAQLVKEVANKTANEAGDGTTTATVLAQAIYNEGLSHILNDVNSIELKRGMDKCTEYIVDKLRVISKPIESEADIINVGTISSNNDESIGKLLAAAMDEVGKDGVITVEESKNSETRLEIVEGLQFDRGYLSHYFISDQTNMQTVLENPYILLYEKRINSASSILKLLEAVSAQGRQLLIIAEDITDEALALLIVNKMRGLLISCAVKAPEFGDRRIQIMEDIAILTNATYITEQKGLRLDKTTIEQLGTCKKITVSKEKCTIIDGAGKEETITKRITDIKDEITNASSDFEKERLQERLAKLSGGVAVISIGASSEVELKEKKDRMEDALHATRAAVEEGIVPGGGMALYNIVKSLTADSTVLGLTNKDQITGANIIMHACKEPFNRILINAGLHPEVIEYRIANFIGKTVTKSDENTDSIGYDVRSGTILDFYSAGIIDPTMVTRTALQNAVSVAGTLLTTEAIIVKAPKKETATNTNLDLGL